ncbi:MAG: hypothetical protein Q7Q73_02165 [Verrucomicrobiota bacterium JB024]|nr:hypothetical protein [Verrucomicrobiota bacterium JB024]
MKRKTTTRKTSGKKGVKPSVPGRLLVVEATGFALYGVVARRSIGGEVTFGVPVMSTATEVDAAIEEVLEKLREQGGKKRLPRNAVLVAASAASEILHLPVDPKNPRPKAQMAELIRWEFEEIYVRQNDIWSLGAMLQGRGYVSAEERHEIEACVTAGRERGSLVNAYRDMISREHLDECMSLQEPLLAMDDDLVIGWSPLPDNGEPGRYAWYCAGMGDGLRAQWVRAFRQHGVFCSWIYPQMGASLPLVEAGSERALLVDIRQEQFGLFQCVNGGLDALSIKACSYGTASPDAVVAAVARFAHADTATVFISAPEECQGGVSDAINQKFPRADVRVLGAGCECPAPVWASLQGVASHALKQCSPQLLPRIQAQPSKPPLWKSKEFWPWAIIALVVVGIIATEVSNRMLTERKEWELELLNIEYDRQMQIKNEASKTQSEIRELTETLAEKEKELAEKQRQIEAIENGILYRQRLVPGLLEAISKSIPANVMVDLLEENDGRTGFYMEGWALEDTSAQLFGSLLSENLAQWHYKVGDIRLTRGKGRFGDDGYVFKIQLTRTTGKKGAGDDR